MSVLKDLDLSNVLVLDIETVSGYKKFEDLDPTMQYLWSLKSKQIQSRKPLEEQLSESESYTEMAGIYSEFGKIVCISVGAFRFDPQTEQWKFYVRSYYDHDERKMLLEFSEMLQKSYYDMKKHKLCGHNIKEFDLPYICRRMIINGLELPNALDLSGKKPWEIPHLDTMDLWKFGDGKAFTALKLLCGIFNIPTPKDDIDGSQVGITYWNEMDLERIQVYCRKDVVATAQVLLKLMLKPILSETQVIYKDQ
jgi:DNA polymerase elongation subunit (family B)